MSDVTTSSSARALQGASEPGTPLGGNRARAVRQGWTLASVAFGVIMVGLDGTVVAIANPYIGRALHGSLADLQWVTNAYLLALAVLLIPMGNLGDRIGRKKVFLAGVAGFALSSLGVGVAGSISGVILLRAVQGVFGAMMMPNTLGIIRNTFPPDKLNRAVGIWGGSSAISIAGGPIVGGLLVEHVNWQSVFFLNVPVGAVALVIGLAVLAESRDLAPRRFDVGGVLLLGASLFCIVFSLVKAETWGWTALRTLGLLVGGIVLLAVFAAYESRVQDALVPMKLFRSISLSVGTIAVLLEFFAMYGVLFFVTLYLQNVHGYDPVAAGVHLLPLTAMFMVASPLGAILNEKLGGRVAVPFGMACLGVGMLLLLALEPASGYIHLWPSFVLVGLGVGIVVVASSDAIVANAPAEEGGVAGGLQSTSVQLGGVLGTSVLGSILATKVGASFSHDLVARGVPMQLAAKLQAARQLVTEGVAPHLSAAPGLLQAAVNSGANAAFMSGLHLALLVGAGVSFLAALVGILIGPPERAGARGPIAI
jgi:EmrB/QacA subfamily drug resistance transporter